MKNCLLALFVIVLTSSISYAQVPGAKTQMPTNTPAAAPTVIETVKKEATPIAETPAPVGVIETTVPRKAKSVEAVSTKMTYKCTKGDALSDAAGKCPKCGAEMVAVSAKKPPIKKSSRKVRTSTTAVNKG